MGRELNAEQIAEFAVEVGDATLRAGEDAEDEIAMGSEALGEQPQRDRLAESRLTGDQCEAALARQVLDAPAEVFELGGDEQRFGGNVGRERVPLETMERQQLGVHGVSSALGLESIDSGRDR